MITEAKTLSTAPATQPGIHLFSVMHVTFITCKDDFSALRAYYLPKRILKWYFSFPREKILAQGRNYNKIYYIVLFSIKHTVHLSAVNVVSGSSGRGCAWVTS